MSKQKFIFDCEQYRIVKYLFECAQRPSALVLCEDDRLALFPIEMIPATIDDDNSLDYDAMYLQFKKDYYSEPV